LDRFLSGAVDEGRAGVKGDKRSGYIDAEGAMPIPARSVFGADFSEGLAARGIRTAPWRMAWRVLVDFGELS